jgi:hypothetical protein
LHLPLEVVIFVTHDGICHRVSVLVRIPGLAQQWQQVSSSFSEAVLIFTLELIKVLGDSQ